MKFPKFIFWLFMVIALAGFSFPANAQTDWDDGLTPSDTLLIKYNWQDMNVDIRTYVLDLDSSQVYQSKPFDISMWNGQDKLYFSAITDTGASAPTSDTLIVKVYEYVDEDYKGLLLKTFTFYGTNASPWHSDILELNPMDSLIFNDDGSSTCITVYFYVL